MGELHDADVLAWSERQARLLQQHAAGEPGNEVPDWANIIGTVERCGKDQLHAAEQLLTQALAQMLKAYAWPLHREVPFWQAEARRLRNDATACTTLSMRQRIDLPGLYADALCRLPERMGTLASLPIPKTCPVTLAELLGSGP